MLCVAAVQLCPRILFYHRAHYPTDDSIDHACRRAIYDNRSRNGEHFHPNAEHPALCLCQDRDEGNFCPILLGFWLLKFLKKSAFFAKLL